MLFHNYEKCPCHISILPSLCMSIMYPQPPGSELHNGSGPPCTQDMHSTIESAIHVCTCSPNTLELMHYTFKQPAFTECIEQVLPQNAARIFSRIKWFLMYVLFKLGSNINAETDPGFPMSQYLKQQHFTVSRNATMVAQQVICFSHVLSAYQDEHNS